MHYVKLMLHLSIYLSIISPLCSSFLVFCSGSLGILFFAAQKTRNKHQNTTRRKEKKMGAKPKKVFENIDVKKSYQRAKKLAVKEKKKKKERKEFVERRQELIDTVPRTLVFRRGQIGGKLSDLISNFKQCVMMPYTAKKLQMSRNVRLFKDLIPIAQDIYVTHFLMFSVTPSGSKLKLSIFHIYFFNSFIFRSVCVGVCVHDFVAA